MRDAKKQVVGADRVLEVLEGITTLHVVKGKRIVTVSLTGSRPSDDELQALLLGPSGNLRAPTLKAGASLVVGFEPGVYREVLTSQG